MTQNTKLSDKVELGDVQIAVVERISPEEAIRNSSEARHTFDNFMWEYVGDPFLDNFPTIRRMHPLAGDCEYGNRLMSYCYSREGSLVHIRRSWEGKPSCKEAEYFVVTADVFAGDRLVEWEVLEVVYNQRESDGLMITLTLRNGADTTSLVLSNQNFLWFSNRSNEPEVLLPGSELSTKLR